MSEIATFEQFWDHYVAAHKKVGTRVLHFIGLTTAGACLAGALFSFSKRRRARGALLLLTAPVIGYGASWIGHFLIEGNSPASFEHPLWSLRGDFKMWWLTLTGSMQAEVDRVVGQAARADEAERVAKAQESAEGDGVEAPSSQSEKQRPSDVVN